MADISQIEVNGTTYDICDATARDSLSSSLITSITRSGTTFTAKNAAGTTLFTFDQQDNNTTYSNATTSTAGLMSAADKTKINKWGTATTSNSWRIVDNPDGWVTVSRDFHKTISANDWLTWGNLYYATISNSVQYPFTFSWRPILQYGIFASEGHEVLGCSFRSTQSVAWGTTNFPGIYAISPSKYSTDTLLSVTVYATSERA